jgi:signal transduction histidine kinase
MDCIAADPDIRFASPARGATRPGAAKAVRSAVVAIRRPPSAADQAAVMAERRRIAREIHDTLAQGFAAIRLQLELARAESGLSPEATRALDLAYQIAGENLVESRRSMAALKSAQPTLESSLSAAIEGVRRLGEVEVIAEVDPVVAPPGEITHELLRIAQEAMLNATRHAGARTLRVSLTAISGGLQLAVVDDGKGFDLARTSPGFGLSGLRERAAGIGAHLSITSAPGLGAQILVTWLSPPPTAVAA